MNNENTNIKLNDDELMHYGRQGMKWYQHIFTSASSIGSSRKSSKASKSEKAATKEAKKTNKRLKKMSDDELKQKISRLKLEKEYKDLKENKKVVTAGKSIVKKVVESTATNLATQTLNHYGGMMLNYATMKADPKIADALKTDMSSLYKGAIYKSKNASDDKNDKKSDD